MLVAKWTIKKHLALLRLNDFKTFSASPQSMYKEIILRIKRPWGGPEINKCDLEHYQ